MSISVSDPLQLPCGASLSNRLAKSAMTEGLADTRNRATARHQALYRAWSASGCGMLLTGNVQVDRRYLERAGNVAVDMHHPQPGAGDALRGFAQAGTERGNHLWMQIGHAGRQVNRLVNPTPAGPSAVALEMGNSDFFAPPRELRPEEVQEVITRFVHVASVAKDTGFTGVQIHAAHGYLISSFLSPRANRRGDQWGGSLENRARLLLQTVAAVREEVGGDYPVSIKLNSADFQQDGFTAEECLQVVEWLNGTGLDLLELSGGNYESPAMMLAARDSTRKREAYFLEYAEAVKAQARMPVMVTGGFRTRSAMDGALAEGATDVVGLARPLCPQPDAAQQLLDDPGCALRNWEAELPAAGAISWYYRQIFHLGDGGRPQLDLDPEQAVQWHRANEAETAQGLQDRDLSA